LEGIAVSIFRIEEETLEGTAVSIFRIEEE
jgi:hypothetical protein